MLWKLANLLGILCILSGQILWILGLLVGILWNLGLLVGILCMVGILCILGLLVGILCAFWGPILWKKLLLWGFIFGGQSLRNLGILCNFWWDHQSMCILRNIESSGKENAWEKECKSIRWKRMGQARLHGEKRIETVGQVDKSQMSSSVGRESFSSSTVAWSLEMISGTYNYVSNELFKRENLTGRYFHLISPYTTIYHHISSTSSPSSILWALNIIHIHIILLADIPPRMSQGAAGDSSGAHMVLLGDQNHLDLS